MKINDLINPFLLGVARPVWDAANEGTAGDTGDSGNDGGGDEGSNEGQTDGVVLGDDGDDAGSEGGGADDEAKDGDDTGDGGDDDDGKGDDDPTDEEKEAAAKAAEVPEDGAYEFELPEGVELPDEKQAQWRETFKEMGLTRGQAQALIDAQSAEIIGEQKAYEEFLDNQQKTHLEEAKADKDIGGDKWQETVKLANAGLRALRGGPKVGKNPDGSEREGKPEGALESLILTSGNGNNPAILRELRRIGQAYADDKFVDGDPRSEDVAPETKWYGDTTPNTKKR